MKKVIVLVAVCFMIISGIFAHKLQQGFRVGFLFPIVSVDQFSGFTVKTATIVGISLDYSLKIPLTEKFTMVTGAGYHNFSFETEIIDNDIVYSTNELHFTGLSVPAGIGYSLTRSCSVYGQASIFFLLNASNKYGDDIKELYNGTWYSVKGGVTYNITETMFADLNYSHVIGDIRIDPPEITLGLINLSIGLFF